MSKQYYDRYSQFKINSTTLTVPFLQISNKGSDILIESIEQTRLDKLSQQYYNTPFYSWLILNSNPNLNSLSYDIPVGTQIRIPYPLTESLNQYQQKLDEFQKFNGN